MNRAFARGLFAVVLPISLAACAGESEDAEQTEDRFTQIEGDPTSSDEPLTALAGRELSVRQQLVIAAGSTSASLGARSGGECWIIPDRALTVERTISAGNRYVIKEVTADEAFGDDNRWRRKTSLELTYAGSSVRPDPFADKIGKTPDFEVFCQVVSYQRRTMSSAEVIAYLRGALDLSKTKAQKNSAP